MNTKKITLLDGAVGTSLWEKTENKVPVWRYNIENPAIVSELHNEYIEAGAQMILANTFGANGGSVSKSPYTVQSVVSRGVALAKEAANGRAKVALSIGPLSMLLEPFGDLSAEDAEALFAEQIKAGMSENPDAILIQTFIDLEMMKIAQKCALRYEVPVYCAMSFDKTGHTMMGNSVVDVINGITQERVDAIGLNCSIGPELALSVIKTFRDNTDLPVLYKPNAGQPITVNGVSQPGTDIETFVSDVIPAADYGVDMIGGCCGTNAKYIKRLGEELSKKGYIAK